MMSKRWIINYLLFTLIIIFTWIGAKYPITEDQLINRNAITTLKAQDINTIQIETADTKLELSKQDGQWYLLQPVQWFASNIAAERISTLATLEPQSRLPSNEIDPATLGLTIPKAVVTLNQQRIYFGDTNRIGNRRYLMVDDQVFLASDIHYPFMQTGISGLLDNRLLPPPVELQSLEFKDFNLTKTEQGWQSSTDSPALAAQQLIDHWRQNQASSIKPFDDSLTPLQKIRAHLSNDQIIEFYLLSIKPQIILARPDLRLQYHFPDHQYYDLLSLSAPAQ